MTDEYTINIRWKDYTHLIVECNYGIAQEFNDLFSFYAKNYRYMPDYKNHIWDGKIRLFNVTKRLLPIGLLKRLVTYCKNDGLEVIIEDEVKEKLKGDKININDIIASFNFPFELHEHQVSSIDFMINKKRGIILSPTSSGKSALIYTKARYNSEKNEKTLIIVPTVQLVEQLYRDFEDYGWDSEKNVHRIYSGKDKEGLKIQITTKDGNVLLFDGNEKLKLINSNRKYINAKDITINHELDDKWLQTINKK